MTERNKQKQTETDDQSQTYRHKHICWWHTATADLHTVLPRSPSTGRSSRLLGFESSRSGFVWLWGDFGCILYLPMSKHAAVTCRTNTHIYYILHLHSDMQLNTFQAFLKWIGAEVMAVQPVCGSCAGLHQTLTQGPARKQVMMSLPVVREEVLGSGPAESWRTGADPKTMQLRFHWWTLRNVDF